MGMSMGGGKGGPSTDINVTPLIDVLLVLLIIFMVITPLTPKGLDALVPQPPPPNQPKNQQPDRTRRRQSPSGVVHQQSAERQWLHRARAIVIKQQRSSLRK